MIISASNQQLDGGKAWDESTSGSSIASFPSLGRNLGTRLEALFETLWAKLQQANETSEILEHCFAHAFLGSRRVCV